MQTNNPIDILEKSGVDDFRVVWGRKTVQLDGVQDLLKIMAHLGALDSVAFSVGGWLFTTEKVAEKYGTFP